MTIASMVSTIRVRTLSSDILKRNLRISAHEVCLCYTLNSAPFYTNFKTQAGLWSYSLVLRVLPSNLNLSQFTSFAMIFLNSFMVAAALIAPILPVMGHQGQYTEFVNQ